MDGRLKENCSSFWIVAKNKIEFGEVLNCTMHTYIYQERNVGPRDARVPPPCPTEPSEQPNSTAYGAWKFMAQAKPAD
jgi:hypothetical protein